ncbi:MAG: SRPBCC domain-containing protein [Crocinitomicaceae bacterium]
MDSLELKTTINASASVIYKDWLTSKAHSEFTGGEAEITAEIGAEYTAWDEYITGTILELTPNQSIKMSWRTSEFAHNEEDSIVEIVLNNISDNETQLILKQTNMPEGTQQKYTDGWNEFYFEPMSEYYNNQR